MAIRAVKVARSDCAFGWSAISAHRAAQGILSRNVATHAPFWQSSHIKSYQEYDAIVIGAGVCGLGAALEVWLAEVQCL